jgi:hypothetical protein
MSQSDTPTGKREKPVPNNAPPRPENPILEKFAWRKLWVEDNNALWAVVGDTGDGKSYASLRLGEVLDPNFTIDNVAFNIVEFIEKAYDDSFGRGSVIILEEGSVEASALEWHSKSNRIFSKILDIWRHQNRMGIINLPNFQALEKGARRRTTGIVKMQYAVPWKPYSQGVFYHSRFGKVEDRFTTPIPVIRGKKRKHIRFKYPSEELVEAFEERSSESKEDTAKELLNELIAEQEDANSDEPDSPAEIADQIIADGNIEHYVKDNYGRKYIDRSLIGVEYDIGDRKAKRVKAKLKEEYDEDVQ